MCWPHLPLKLCVDLRFTFPPLLLLCDEQAGGYTLVNYMDHIQNRRFILFLRVGVSKVLFRTCSSIVGSSPIQTTSELPFKRNTDQEYVTKNAVACMDFVGTHNHHSPFFSKRRHYKWMNMYIVSEAPWKVYCNHLLFTMAIIKFTHILFHAYKKRPNILILFRQAPCMFIFTSQRCNTYLFFLYLTLPYLTLSCLKLTPRIGVWGVA